jgi:SAM-dependent methyltransferase
MLMTKIGETNWETLGREDPYWAVFTHAKFHRDNLDVAAREEFFRSGREHVDLVLRTARERLDPDFRPLRALDFGCGVGRLVLPLAAECPHVVGVDVSPSMLAETRRNCDREGVTGVELVEGDDTLSRVDGKFDLIHSFIVFQHIPPRRGMRIAAELLGRLDEGGVGALHFTFVDSISPLRRVVRAVRRWVPPINRVLNVVRGVPADFPLIQMHAYDLSDVLALLERSGCHQVYLRYTDHAKFLGVLLFFQKGKLPAL